MKIAAIFRIAAIFAFLRTMADNYSNNNLINVNSTEKRSKTKTSIRGGREPSEGLVGRI